MSMPRRSSSLIAASVLQAGPMVQMILARRTEGLSVAGSAIDAGLLALKQCPQSGLRYFIVEPQLATSMSAAFDVSRICRFSQRTQRSPLQSRGEKLLTAESAEQAAENADKTFAIFRHPDCKQRL